MTDMNKVARGLTRIADDMEKGADPKSSADAARRLVTRDVRVALVERYHGSGGNSVDGLHRALGSINAGKTTPLAIGTAASFMRAVARGCAAW